MSPSSFTILFLGFLLLSIVIRFWLASRHVHHIRSNRHAVPAQFADRVSLVAHQRAADYTIAKTRFSLFVLLLNSAVLIGFTLMGGLTWLATTSFDIFGSGIRHQLALILAFALISGVIELPFDYFRQFRLEAAFGFNRMTPALFFTDMVKSTVISLSLGLGLAWIALLLMEKAGNFWWLYAWFVWCSFQLLMLVLVPLFIAPLFNKFEPLKDDSLRTRIENLMQRTGFSASGLFVMDGSRRSTHGNAYFSGFGAAKRIVFFDTLLTRLAPQEIEAVLAHELGHFKCKHIIKRIILMFSTSLALLALLGYLKEQNWFYLGLGVTPLEGASNDAMALLLFALILPVFSFLFSPIMSLSSRQHEFEADAFAAKHTQAQDLVCALVKLYEDNASTLTPDPLHSAFYDSHPPASVRIQHLLSNAYA